MNPVGSNTAVRYALHLYGLTDYVVSSKGLPFLTVADLINKNYPIYMRMGGIDNNKEAANNEVNHAVTICGYEYSISLSDYYVVMDPNVNSRVYISVDGVQTKFIILPEVDVCTQPYIVRRIIRNDGSYITI